MRYDLVIFDLDGTLLDTSGGIIHCYNTVAERFGYPMRPHDQFRGIIGGALPDNFKKYFGAKQEEVRDAVELYREEYARNGRHIAAHYPGMAELLRRLKELGIKTAVATLKREDFAVQMMGEFGLAPYLDLIYGMDEADTRTKTSIIENCIYALGVEKRRVVMVGDSTGDLRGAEAAGVDFIGVTYGWGFDQDDQREDNEHVYVDTVCALQARLTDNLTRDQQRT